MTCALLVLSGLVSAAGAVRATDVEQSCCFSNPAFAGVCQVTPTADETCKSILGYLNAPGSVGKTYCGDTNIRGGWEQTSCASSARRQDWPPEPAPRQIR